MLQYYSLYVVVVLNIFPNIVLEKVMELFYFGQICVLGALKNKVMKALEFLQVKSLYVPNSHHIPILTHAVQSAIKQPENQFQTTSMSMKVIELKSLLDLKVYF